MVTPGGIPNSVMKLLYESCLFARRLGGHIHAADADGVSHAPDVYKPRLVGDSRTRRASEFTNHDGGGEIMNCERFEQLCECHLGGLEKGSLGVEVVEALLLLEMMHRYY